MKNPKKKAAFSSVCAGKKEKSPKVDSSDMEKKRSHAS